MASALESDQLAVIIRKAIEREVADALDREVERIAERVRTILRQKAGAIAVSVLSHYEIRQDQRRLIITVKGPEEPS